MVGCGCPIQNKEGRQPKVLRCGDVADGEHVGALCPDCHESWVKFQEMIIGKLRERDEKVN